MQIHNCMSNLKKNCTLTRKFMTTFLQRKRERTSVLNSREENA